MTENTRTQPASRAGGRVLPTAACGTVPDYRYSAAAARRVTRAHRAHTEREPSRSVP